MSNEEWISASEFCNSHHIEVSFIYSLQKYGLVEVSTMEEIVYLPAYQLPQVEKMARLYSDLGINLEGIDAIGHLLQRVKDMQSEIRMLKSKLRIYEGIE